ncbi:Crp/Fnr family transcriptional regulator [Roseivirga sp.]|uniref:Crp/Fnr family transcriptional regulator n=1 Tax=Roseivirga sp. TaxID=1964215 RepID=UPI002B26D280|nr:Crp/Fnr family transcriptional regulator [Roseivirga sp.]
MTVQEILNNIGQFSDFDAALFEKLTSRKVLEKNEIILKEGEVCKSIFYIVSGSFFQYQNKDISEIIIDLHLQGEWMYNHESLLGQTPSKTIIKTFSKAEVIELSLENFHFLSSKAQSFLQFGKILNPTQSRTYIFDNSLSPSEKYDYIKKVKPLLAQVFPIKMIASYLKIAPETLSRVRAQY